VVVVVRTAVCCHDEWRGTALFHKQKILGGLNVSWAMDQRGGCHCRLFKEPFGKRCVELHQCADTALPPSPFLGSVLLGASLGPTCASLESGSVQPTEKADW